MGITPEMAAAERAAQQPVPPVAFQKAVSGMLDMKKAALVRQTGFRNERDYDRAQAVGRAKRAKKTNAKRSKAWREQVMSVETLAAQLRIATGGAPEASPALVANARKALQPKIAEMQGQFPGLSDDEAMDAMLAGIEALR